MDWFWPVDAVLYDTFLHAWKGEARAGGFITRSDVTYLPLDRCVDDVEHHPVRSANSEWELTIHAAYDPIDDGCGIHAYSQWTRSFEDVRLGVKAHGNGNVECDGRVVERWNGDRERPIWGGTRCYVMVQVKADGEWVLSQELPEVLPDGVEPFMIERP